MDPSASLQRRMIGRGLVTAAAGQVGALASGIGISAVLARGLGPSAFGEYILVLALASTMGVVADLGVARAIHRYAPELRANGAEHRLFRFAAPFYVVRFVAAAALTAVLLAARPLVAGWLNIDAALTLSVVLLIGGYVVAQAALQPLQAALSSSYRQEFLHGVVNATNLAYLAALASLWATGNLTMTTAFVAVIVQMAVQGVLYATAFVSRRTAGTPDAASQKLRDIQARTARYAGIMLLVGIGGYVLQYRSDAYFLAAMAGAHAVVFYQLAQNLSQKALQAASPKSADNMLAGSMAEDFVRSGAGAIQPHFARMVRLQTALKLPVAAGGAVVAHHVVALIYGAEYSDAAPLVAAFFAADAVLAWAPAVAAVLAAIEKPHITMWTRAFGVLGIGLNLLLIPVLGVYGALLSSTASSFLALLVEYLFARRMTGISLPTRQLLPFAAAAALMGGGVFLLDSQLSLHPALAIAIEMPIGGAVYISLALLFGGLSPSERAGLRASTSSLLQLITPRRLARGAARVPSP